MNDFVREYFLPYLVLYDDDFWEGDVDNFHFFHIDKNSVDYLCLGDSIGVYQGSVRGLFIVPRISH